MSEKWCFKALETAADASSDGVSLFNKFILFYEEIKEQGHVWKESKFSWTWLSWSWTSCRDVLIDEKIVKTCLDGHGLQKGDKVEKNTNDGKVMSISLQIYLHRSYAIWTYKTFSSISLPFAICALHLKPAYSTSNQHTPPKNQRTPPKNQRTPPQTQHTRPQTGLLYLKTSLLHLKPAYST